MKSLFFTATVNHPHASVCIAYDSKFFKTRPSYSYPWPGSIFFQCIRQKKKKKDKKRVRKDEDLSP